MIQSEHSDYYVKNELEKDMTESLFIRQLVQKPEKAMAPHSSTLAWKIPWMEDPRGPQSMGSLRVGHDRATSLSLFTFMHWRRKWQPTPVFLPENPRDMGAQWAAVYGDRTESDTTEVTQQQQCRNTGQR